MALGGYWVFRIKSIKVWATEPGASAARGVRVKTVNSEASLRPWGTHTFDGMRAGILCSH